MTNDPFQLYPTIAQVAAVFAGFGSLASGLGSRSGGDDARVDAYRLGFMLFSSLSATLLGLIPATLAGLAVVSGMEVRISAGVGVIALAVFLPLSTSRIFALRHVSGFSISGAIANTACTGTAAVAFAICALGTQRGAAVYLVGLMGLLGSSMVMFARVIASMLRRHNKAGKSSD
jgi:hypothetical protein